MLDTPGQKRRPRESVKTQAAKQGTRSVLSSLEDVRAAVVEITGVATRGLAILTPDLEPEVYDHDDFLETLKRFVLARSFARIRVLIVDPARAFKNGNRFVTMGRRLNSYIEFRNVVPEFRNQEQAFCIADEIGIVYRPLSDHWRGMADRNEPVIARKYLDLFDKLWQASGLEPELRQLSL
jgi:hypothetical protein